MYFTFKGVADCHKMIVLCNAVRDYLQSSKEGSKYSYAELWVALSNLVGTPRPYLTFIVGTLVQGRQCRHQIKCTGEVLLYQNSLECKCNV